MRITVRYWISTDLQAEKNDNSQDLPHTSTLSHIKLLYLESQLPHAFFVGFDEFRAILFTLFNDAEDKINTI